MTTKHLAPLSLLGLSLMACSSEQQSTQPNVILIMADDLGWGDVGFNGNQTIHTPNLDQMAADGVRFDRFYSASSVSSPTRASVLTGRNPYRQGIFNANMGILRPEEITLPELLKEQGYATGHFGKWHLGSLTHTEKDANRGKVGNTKDYNPPILHGYDDAFVTESKVPTWDPMLKPAGRKDGHGWSAIKEGEASEIYGTYYWNIDGNKITDNLEGDDSRVIMDRVLPFIEKSKKANKPFFSVIWFHTPHAPCVAGPEYAKMYENESTHFQNYAGCVTAMDDQIGRLRAYLKEQGLDENTMIWFCSDNGPENGSAGVTGGHLERKRSLHEGGVRVPGCMVWPAQVASGQSIETPMWTCDYMPTIANAAGIEPAKLSNTLDGIDLMPILTGKQTERNSPFVICYDVVSSYNTDGQKLYVNKDTKLYYDIANDRYEQNPDSTHQDIVEAEQAMQAIINSYRSSFEGDEYGQESYNRMGHTWANHNFLKPQQPKKNAKKK